MYDAWGNHKVLTASGIEDTSPTFIGNINPFRYRSYYFDTETGFYYLQSRYYDPQVGRFISMDSVENIDESVVNGINLYAYCLNNPINASDPDGTWLNILIGAVVGAVVGFATGVVKDFLDDGKVFNGSVSAGEYVARTVVGTAVGAAVGAAGPAVVSFAGQSFSFTMGASLSLGSSGAAVVSAGMTVTVTGAQVLAGAGTIIGALFSISMHGTPNSSITSGGSYGEYDSNGNLSYRVDTTGKPHFIKEIQQYALPHTHKFEWSLIDGIWRYVEQILPYII